MLELIVAILVILFLTGNLHVSGIAIPNATLLHVNGQAITLWNVLIFIVVMWALGVLPSHFREIVGVLLVLWVLSVLGFLAITGLSNILVIAVIIGIVMSIIKRK
jgi:hypothetical protein